MITGSISVATRSAEHDLGQQGGGQTLGHLEWGMQAKAVKHFFSWCCIMLQTCLPRMIPAASTCLGITTGFVQFQMFLWELWAWCKHRGQEAGTVLPDYFTLNAIHTEKVLLKAVCPSTQDAKVLFMGRFPLSLSFLFKRPTLPNSPLGKDPLYVWFKFRDELCMVMQKLLENALQLFLRYSSVKESPSLLLCSYTLFSI